MQLTIIQPNSLADRIRRSYLQKKALKTRARNIAHIEAIAGQYGYGPESDEVQAIFDGWDLAVDILIDTAFSEEENWHKHFNPLSSIHVDYSHNDTLMIMQYPWTVTMGYRQYGASRADVVRAHLSEGWEQTCDRIVVDSHLTTFFDGDTPVVIFYASGRDGGRADNAQDALRTHANLEVEMKDIFVKTQLMGSISDLVFEKRDGEWVCVAR